LGDKVICNPFPSPSAIGSKVFTLNLSPGFLTGTSTLQVQNAMKQSQCTPAPQELSKETKNMIGSSSWFGGSHKYKQKQTNYLPP
jgi:hypothetical protein